MIVNSGNPECENYANYVVVCEGCGDINTCQNCLQWFCQLNDCEEIYIDAKFEIMHPLKISSIIIPNYSLRLITIHWIDIMNWS